LGQNFISLTTGEAVSFIDDIIVRTKEDTGHDKVMKEVVRRFVENYLYIKPEKYKWKV